MNEYHDRVVGHKLAKTPRWILGWTAAERGSHANCDGKSLNVRVREKDHRDADVQGVKMPNSRGTAKKKKKKKKKKMKKMKMKKMKMKKMKMMIMMKRE
ncbi:hypothetical protein N7508_010245 [Penicillium antarcticum]|uniref:uncharacterized protein n=1 Tax=Penicillium antarcticum TaxID=416450 RepID=UPI00239BCF72|nr:uncharacterized protein N7508_010245 [Penicillium antarcticum]KAJ5295424.1 hypothetical protein N7508_010245 [Penicillium antarcticum]